jgi:transaldolase/glucose-6-phosphate isomerase
MYIDNLIGKDTVNTVPPATLKAFKDHGKVAGETILDDIDDSERILDMLAEVGIDLDDVTRQLQVDGVELFAEAFQSLLDQVDAKRNVLKTGVIQQQNLALGIYGDAVEAAVKQLNSDKFNTRIWAHDGSLWKDHGPTIAKIEKRLGWLDVLTTIDRARLQALQDSVRNGDFDHVVLLGMGGSSLAPEVLYQTFGKQPGFPAFLMLDSTDPGAIRNIETAINPKRALFLVSSKSGGTIETSSFYKHFYQLTGENGAQFIAITDTGSELEALAREKNFRDTFLNPEDIGGRYSALSYFGMVPAALMGVDLAKMWAEAERMVTACGPKIPGALHPGIWLGAIIGTLAKQGRDKVSVFCSESLASYGSWVEQLIAESTGKEGTGALPVVGGTVGSPHDYGSDRLLIYVRVEGDSDNEEMDARIRALREAGHPRVTLYLPDKYALAGEFFRWEYATAVAGKLLDINPFDEPNVTESKQNTSRLLDYYREHGHLPAAETAFSTGNVSLYADDQMLRVLSELCLQHNYSGNDLISLLAAQINSTRLGDYFAILAYLPSIPEVNEALEDIRRRLRHTSRRAVTVGFGPRYLHSTGQLHKGGANNGIFFQITCDDPRDVAIPGEPYSFSILKAAQAAGDLEALRGKERRALRLHISGDLVQGLKVIQEAVEEADKRRN